MADKDFFNGKPPADVTPPENTAPPAYRYRCVEACTFMKMYRKPGDIVTLPGKRDIPHFEPVI
jgi:hypothetical protein